MSICPKINLPKEEEEIRESKLENECSELGKMQQMWCSYDAAQSMQSLWIYNKKEIVSVD